MTIARYFGCPLRILMFSITLITTMLMVSVYCLVPTIDMLVYNLTMHIVRYVKSLWSRTITTGVLNRIAYA